MIRRLAHGAACQLMSPAGVHAWGEPLFLLNGRRGSLPDLSRIERLLIVRLDEIGDVVLTTPSLREWRKNLPHGWITLVVKPAVYNLVERCPYVNEVLTYDWNVAGFGPLRQVGARPHFERLKRVLRLARRSLWRRRYDLAVLPRWDADHYHGTILAYLSGARRRLGYSEKTAGSAVRLYKGLDRLLTDAVLGETEAHEVERSLNLLKFMGGSVASDSLELWIGDNDELFATRALEERGVLPGEPLIAVCPGAGESKRVWPANRLAAVANWIAETYGMRIVLIGGPGDSGPADEFRKLFQAETIDVVGRTELRQTAALLKRCALFIGNDSGPMHMAAAVNTRVVCISCHPLTGSPTHHNSPRRFGPWGEHHVVIQPRTALPPCDEACISDHAHCILGVSVESVKAAIEEILAPKEELLTAENG
jgi:lipopolysaccharide heptosyltransferase II